jgi:integrase
MAKKRQIDYASMFTRRKDGRYVYSKVDPKTGKRMFLYDRDPEKLWHKVNDPKEPEIIYFKRIADEWEGIHFERINYKTAEAYTAPLRRIKERFGDIPAKDITAAEIQAYLNVLGKQGYSRRSVQMHRDILNMIFNSAIVAGYMTVNPCAAVSMPRNLPTKKRELPSDAALEAVRDNLSAPFGLFAYLCLYSGLRRGEALALRYEDIDRGSGVIHVNKTVEFIGNNPHVKNPKSDAGYRDVILLDVLAAAIPEGTGLVFPSPDGKMLTKMQYRKRWLKYCEVIGHDITAHQLRHGYATILYEAGIQDKDAQELLGHSSITITRDVYTHVRQSKKTEAAKRLNDYVVSGVVNK